MKLEAVAFLIWRYADPIGWDCTAGECARAIDVPLGVARYAIQRKGWGSRFRTTKHDVGGAGYTVHGGAVGRLRTYRDPSTYDGTN